MSPFSVLAASILTFGLWCGPTSPAGAASDPLAAYQWRKRVLLVVAPDEQDPGVAAQRQAFRAMAAGAGERELVLVEAFGTGARALALRQAFGLEGRAFAAVLVGKDGGAKLRSPVPLGAAQLFPTIDAMPMRRDEMGRPRNP